MTGKTPPTKLLKPSEYPSGQLPTPPNFFRIAAQQGYQFVNVPDFLPFAETFKGMLDQWDDLMKEDRCKWFAATGWPDMHNRFGFICVREGMYVAEPIVFLLLIHLIEDCTTEMLPFMQRLPRPGVRTVPTVEWPAEFASVRCSIAKNKCCCLRCRPTENHILDKYGDTTIMPEDMVNNGNTKGKQRAATKEVSESEDDATPQPSKRRKRRFVSAPVISDGPEEEEQDDEDEDKDVAPPAKRQRTQPPPTFASAATSAAISAPRSPNKNLSPYVQLPPALTTNRVSAPASSHAGTAGSSTLPSTSFPPAATLLSPFAPSALPATTQPANIFQPPPVITPFSSWDTLAKDVSLAVRQNANYIEILNAVRVALPQSGISSSTLLKHIVSLARDMDTLEARFGVRSTLWIPYYGEILASLVMERRVDWTEYTDMGTLMQQMTEWAKGQTLWPKGAVESLGRAMSAALK